MQVPTRNTIPPGIQTSSGNEKANIPNDAEECSNGGAIRHSRILLQRVPVKHMHDIRRMASCLDTKQLNAHLNAPTTLSHVQYKLSSEYRKKGRLLD